MSILNRLNRLTGRHLDDAALAAIWTRENAAQPGSADPHLDQCAECRVRLDAFAAWMEEIAADAALEADAAFPPERLAAQQAHVLRRLESAERPARVIVFPKYSREAHIPSAPVRRWVAAAAAAGLLVGVGLGQLLDFRHPADKMAQRLAVARNVTPAPNQPTHGVIPASTSANEETLLQELEAASTPQYEALRAFDTLTPRAADFQTSR